jgi:hypothetical protein
MGLAESIVLPELGFSSRDFGSKYHNLYSTTPCLMRPFSELPSMVAIDKFDYLFFSSPFRSVFANNSAFNLHFMKVSTENDNNFGYEKITIVIDNIPLKYVLSMPVARMLQHGC